VFVTIPPPVLLVIERSYEGEVNEKVSPLERETITLVAFRVRTSATEPEETVRVVEGEVSLRPTGAMNAMFPAYANECRKKTEIIPIPRAKKRRFILVSL
jgi:hypothetical protein